MNFPFLKNGSAFTQLSVSTTISTSCAGHCDQCIHKKKKKQPSGVDLGPLKDTASTTSLGCVEQ